MLAALSLPGAVAHGQRARGGLSLCRLPRLCARLHDLAEAAHAPEHRDRRRGRRRPAARRLGRRRPARSAGPPCCCSSSCSSGRRRTSGRCSLLMKDEYAKVGVPMLPVVRGEAETRRQILLYTVLLYAVTQLPFCAGGLGGIYLPPRCRSARVHLRRRAALPPRRSPLGAAPSTSSRWPIWRCCSRRWSSTEALGYRRPVASDPRANPPASQRLYASADMDRRLATQEHPHRPDRRRDLHVHVRIRSSSRRSTSREPARPRDAADRRGDPPAGAVVLPLLTAAPRWSG